MKIESTNSRLVSRDRLLDMYPDGYTCRTYVDGHVVADLLEDGTVVERLSSGWFVVHGELQ